MNYMSIARLRYGFFLFVVAVAAFASSATEAVAIKTNLTPSRECTAARNEALTAFIFMSIVSEEIDALSAKIDNYTNKIKEIEGYYFPDYQLLGELQRNMATAVAKLSSALEELERWKVKYADAQSKKGRLCPFGV